MDITVAPIPLHVTSAYRQLSAVERDYVDRYIPEIERRADTATQPFAIFARTIPADLYDTSRGLLDRPIVLAAIAERIKSITEESALTPWRVMKELQNIIFANMADYTELTIDTQGNVSRVVDPSNCTPEQWAAVKKWKIEETAMGGRKVDFELHDKLNAIGKVMVIMGLNEAGNAYWRDQEAKANNIDRQTATIDAGATDQDAADAWQTYLENAQ